MYESYTCLPLLLQDVIRTICSPYGFVQRIVIFRKNGLQVLVEYPLSLFLSTLSWNYAE